MLASTQSLERAGLDECVSQHRRSGVRSALASSLIAISMVAVVWRPALGIGLWGWLVLLFAVQAARVAVGWLHGRDPQADERAPVWRLRYRVAVALHGIAWALLAVAVLRYAGDGGQDQVLFALAVVVSGSLIVTSFDPVAAGAFALPTGGVGLWALMGPNAPSVSAVTLIAVALTGVALHSMVRARRDMTDAQARRVQEAERLAETIRLAAAADAARRELAEKHHMMTLLLRTTAQGFWHVGVDGVTVDVNPAMCRLLGRPREQIMGRPASDFFVGESLERLRRELAMRREGIAGQYELDIVRPDGSVLHCLNNATPVLDPAGQRIGSVGLWTDITALRAHERAQHAYELVANSIHDIVSVLDEGQNYRLVNDAWCRATGLAREAVLGRNAEEVFPAVPTPARREAYERCTRLRVPSVVNETAVNVPSLSGRAIESTYYPYADETGVRYVAIVSRDITQQEADRRQLAETAEYLARTLNATGDAIFASDARNPDEPVRFANEPLYRLWNLPDSVRERLTPAIIMAHATPMFEDPEAEVRCIQSIIASNAPHESVVRLRDGRVIARRCVPAQMGERAVRVWSFRDITAERRALESAQASEAEQRALLDAFPGYIARLDLQGHYTYVNQRMADLCEVPAHAIIGQTVGTLVGPDERAVLRGALERAARGEPVTFEYYRAASTGGGGNDVQITVAHGTHPGTGVPALYAFGIDITDRKRAEKALRASETELRALLDAFPGFIAALDGDLRYQFVNDSLTKLLRRRRDELMGRSITEVLDPARLQEVVADISAARAGDRPSHERHYPAVDGRPSRDVEVTHVAGPVRPDGTQVIYAFGTDVTARKVAEDALIAARDEAERANLAKSQFLSQMSHELRTPMNAIIGLGQLLVSDPLRPLVPTQQAYVHEMLRGARHLLDLINEVLDLGRVEAGQLAVEPATVRLAEVVEECASLVRPLAAEHQVTIALPPPCNFHVHVDRTRLKQVLLNLLGNAVKYNRRPGSVMVACGVDGDNVRLLVRDTGRGLTAEEQQRLFRPFERLGAARSGIEGTGIGLALSRRLVEAMGGAIGVESELGIGSTFWLQLPRAEAPDSQRPSAAAPAGHAAAATGGPAPAAGRRRPTVLYIEDNPVNVFVMEALFERMPELRLVSAPTPAEGLQFARTEPPALVLLDVQLPDMDGAEVLARLKAHARTRDIPVVAVSANAMSTDIDTMMAAGAADYLTKPVDLDRLLSVVKQLVVDA